VRRAAAAGGHLRRRARAAGQVRLPRTARSGSRPATIPTSCVAPALPEIVCDGWARAAWAMPMPRRHGAAADGRQFLQVRRAAAAGNQLRRWACPSRPMPTARTGQSGHQTGDNSYECVAPPPEIGCDGGRLRHGQCQCPDGTERQRTRRQSLSMRCTAAAGDLVRRRTRAARPNASARRARNGHR